MMTTEEFATMADVSRQTSAYWARNWLKQKTIKPFTSKPKDLILQVRSQGRDGFKYVFTDEFVEAFKQGLVDPPVQVTKTVTKTTTR